MQRRHFVAGALGSLAALAGGAALLRPSDEGAPYNDYFRALNEELKRNGPMRPSLLIDLDRLDHNIDQVVASVTRSGKALRVVEKSLPSPALLDYILRRANTRLLMSFHQPFLNLDAQTFPDADLLLGKPLPHRSAALFYEQLRGPFDPARRLQWLIDTPQRLQDYLALARSLGTRMQINIEINVGLHRGGVNTLEELDALLTQIAAEPQHLHFSGFMGYDPHVGMGVPEILGTHQELLAKVMARYQSFVDFTRERHAPLWREGLTLNTAGSPNYRLHEAETLSTEVSVGTGMLKPTHYDLDTLAEHVSAVYIATPILKKTGPVMIPALDGKSRLFSAWDVNQRETFFLYGGNWMAEYESPQGLRANAIYGRSSNQEIVTASAAVQLHVEDHVFLRPMQTEFVLLQFGDLIALRGGKIEARWPVFAQTG